MRNLGGVCLFFGLILVVSGCVSKKKYLAMETLKNQYLKQSTALQKENESLKGDLKSSEVDFEAMKQNLHYSDARKGEELESLSQKLKEREESFNRAQTELSKTRDLYKDQRYYNSQASNEITRLEFAIEQFKRDTISLNYSLKLARERAAQVQNRLDERVDQLNAKGSEIAKLNNEIAANAVESDQLKAQIAEQKVKLDEISAAFIELRKEMLRAKANNTIIDPGTDPNVIKISKSLGHF